MNPLDLPGQSFLFFYGTCVIASVAFAVLSARLGRSPADRAGDADLDALDGTELAWLKGGPKVAVAAAVAALAHRGRVRFGERKVSLVEEAKKDRELVADGVYRGVVREKALPPLESAVLAGLARRGGTAGLGDLVWECSAAIDAVELSLAQRGLALGRERRQRRVRLALAPIVLTMLVGMAKVFVGVSRDRPVLFLVLALGGSAVVVWLIFAGTNGSRATVRGEDALDRLADRNDALRRTAASAPQQLSPAEVSLAVGIFGAAIVGGALAPLAQFITPAPAPGGDGGSSSCSGCGGGGCGGGGGGGCGGCGGH